MTRRWLVGLDLRPDAPGPLRFARWLAGEEANLSGLHVIETRRLPAGIRDRYLPAIGDGAKRLAEEVAQTQGGPIPAIDVVAAAGAEDGLAANCSAFDGIVMGRWRKIHGRSLIRLGRVARRMLRMLPRPVVVVPPDLERIGAGPIIMATDMTEDCVAALQLAWAVADQQDRELLVVHVVTPHETELEQTYGLEDDTWEAIRGELRRDRGQQAREWVDRHRVTPKLVVVHGEPLTQLLELGEQEDAPLMVVGARRVSADERVYLSNVGTELAARARCAVAVVPGARTKP